MEDDATPDSPRLEELFSMKAIFPDANISLTGYTADLEIPIVSDEQIIVCVKEQPHSLTNFTELPPARIKFDLVKGYPHISPPRISLEAPWLRQEEISCISGDMIKIWYTLRDYSMYLIWDEARQRILDLTKPKYEVDSSEKLATFVAFDKLKKQEIFDSKTFTCEICRDDKKGLYCSSMPLCNHVFCKQCLREYFADVLKSGDIERVHCPDYDCTKRHLEHEKQLSTHFDSIENFSDVLTQVFAFPLPVELLQSISEPALVERFVALFERQRFEMLAREYPAKVAHCPRESCKMNFINNNDSNALCVCPACAYAYCKDCLHSWHGTTNSCGKSNKKTVPIDDVEAWIEATEDSETRNKLAQKHGKKVMAMFAGDYLAERSLRQLVLDESSDIQKCPSCDMLIQRSDGCNKMRCTGCKTMFCNLCGDFLPSEDPYLHYKSAISSCYGRLFEGLIQGDDIPHVHLRRGPFA